MLYLKLSDCQHILSSDPYYTISPACPIHIHLTEEVIYIPLLTEVSMEAAQGAEVTNLSE